MLSVSKFTALSMTVSRIVLAITGVFEGGREEVGPVAF